MHGRQRAVPPVLLPSLSPAVHGRQRAGSRRCMVPPTPLPSPSPAAYGHRCVGRGDAREEQLALHSRRVGYYTPTVRICLHHLSVLPCTHRYLGDCFPNRSQKGVHRGALQ
jgi:hypothetical protein